jgi:hypothetical protein
LRNFHQKCDRSVCCLTIRALHPLNNREQKSIIQSKIQNLKSQIGRSHFRTFHQKCDRSVCCLTIRALDRLNNPEQRSIIQSKISNLKSQIGRSHFRTFHQKCDRSVCCFRSVCCLTITALDPPNNPEQRSIIQSKISNLKSKIGRSHFGNFPQKCDRSVCCLTIRALDPLNNPEQRSIIQSKIQNLKSKIDRLFNLKSKI